MRQGVPDVDEVLFGVLAENVGKYLDGVERLAQQARAEELRRLVAAWRAVLDIHRPAGRRGRCAGCAPAGRGGAAMCSVWRVASAFFLRGPG